MQKSASGEMSELMEKGPCAMYVKLFTQILDSSIADNRKLRHFFTDLLLCSDSKGFVIMTESAIARRIGATLDEVSWGLSELQKADACSKTMDANGARIERLEGVGYGWRIINFEHYRALKDADQLRDATRERVRRHRANKKAGNADVTKCNGGNANTEAEAEAEAEADTDNLLLDVGEITPPKVGRKPSQRQGAVDDEEWLVSLENDSAYAGIPIRVELGKMQRWCEVRHKSPSRARFINWLNRAEKPIGVNGQHRPKHEAYDPASATAGATADEIGKF